MFVQIVYLDDLKIGISEERNSATLYESHSRKENVSLANWLSRNLNPMEKTRRISAIAGRRCHLHLRAREWFQVWSAVATTACLFNARSFISHMTILVDGRIARILRYTRDLTCGLSRCVASAETEKVNTWQWTRLQVWVKKSKSDYHEVYHEV